VCHTALGLVFSMQCATLLSVNRVAYEQESVAFLSFVSSGKALVLSALNAPILLCFQPVRRPNGPRTNE